MTQLPDDLVQYTAYLEGSLKLSERGEWWHNGKPFSNEKISQLFHRSILWDQALQRYVVRLGVQQATFEVSDTAYFINELITDRSPWKIVLSDGSEEELLPATLSVGPEGQTYCLVKTNHRARFSRSAHQALMSYVVDEKTVLIDNKPITLKKQR